MMRIKILIFCFLAWASCSSAQNTKAAFIKQMDSLLRLDKFHSIEPDCKKVTCFDKIDCVNKYKSLKGRIECFYSDEAELRTENRMEFEYLTEAILLHPIFKNGKRLQYDSFKKIRSLEGYSKYNSLHSIVLNSYAKNAFSGEVSLENIYDFNNETNISVEQYLELYNLIETKDTFLLKVPTECIHCNKYWEDYLNSNVDTIWGSGYLDRMKLLGYMQNAKKDGIEKEKVSAELSKKLGFDIDLNESTFEFIWKIVTKYFVFWFPLILIIFSGFIFRMKIGKIFSSIYTKLKVDQNETDNPDQNLTELPKKIIDWSLIIKDLDKNVETSIIKLSNWLIRNEDAILKELKYDKSKFVDKSVHEALEKELKDFKKLNKVVESKNVHQAPPTEYPSILTIKYADPPIGGYFRELSDKPFMLPFEIEIKGNTASFSTVKNNELAQIAAIQGHMNTLQSCCTYENQPTGNNNLETVRPGTLILEGGAWKMKTKAIIRFS